MRFSGRAIWCVCLVLLLATHGSRAQETSPSEYQLKAAFLYNFAKFVEWPTNVFALEDSPIVVGVMGQNPFGEDLDNTIRNKTINKHPIEIKATDSISDAKKCQILFISTSERDRLADILSGLRGASVLTVGEADTQDFIKSGGMINFVLVNNKIRFQINNEAAKSAGLKISSKLLSLAQP